MKVFIAIAVVVLAATYAASLITGTVYPFVIVAFAIGAAAALIAARAFFRGRQP